ncbi:hypothetical protein BH11PLA1_BH11PLA1_18900 [soil metagenome]
MPPRAQPNRAVGHGIKHAPIKVGSAAPKSSLGAAKVNAPKTAAGSSGLRRTPVLSSVAPRAAVPMRSTSPQQALALRTLFWSNCVREMLMSLSAMVAADPATKLDGRVAILTHAGERIPIAEVHPLFACSIATPDAERDLSALVQCSVFRIVTPSGEAFTFPLSEIRGLHALTEELQQQIEAELAQAQAGDEPARPFGFAAFAATMNSPLLNASLDAPPGGADSDDPDASTVAEPADRRAEQGRARAAGPAPSGRRPK